MAIFTMMVGVHCTRAAILREGRVIACGEVGSLMKTGARRVTFRGQAPISALSGLKDLHRHDGAASFLYDGELNRLLSVLAAGDIRDLSITEPDLEEVFLHYYTDGGEDPAESGKDAPLQTISGRNEP